MASSFFVFAQQRGLSHLGDAHNHVAVGVHQDSFPQPRLVRRVDVNALGEHLDIARKLSSGFMDQPSDLVVVEVRAMTLGPLP